MGPLNPVPREGVLLTIGETMAVVTPVEREPLVSATAFRLDAGGAESNVAGHVVHRGHRARWVSRLGDDALGRRIHRLLTDRGIDVSGVHWDDSAPTGLYVKDPGRPVAYYRRGSAASHLLPADIDRIPLDDVAVVHLTGITPALSDGAAAAVSRLIDRAREAGVLVSFDINHRPALWSPETAAPVLLALARRADVVFVGLDEAARLWGCEQARAVRTLLDRAVLVVKDGAIGATAFDGDDEVFSPALRVDVVEEVGAGDAFAGGFLAGLLDGVDLPAKLAAGHAQAALTLASTSDFLEEHR